MLFSAITPYVLTGRAAALTTFIDTYPDHGAVDHNVSAYEWWVDENHDNMRQVTSNATDDDELMSTRGYYYRNCTDGAAYWVNTYTGVDVRGWSHAYNWDNAAGTAGRTVKAGTSNAIEPGDIAQSDDGTYGHVGFVTSVNKGTDGVVTSFTTAELNKSGSGEYSGPDVNIYSQKNSSGKFVRGSNDWDHFIDVNGSGKGLNNEVIGSTSNLPTRVSAIQYSSTEMTAFKRGTDNKIYKDTYQSNAGTWSGWQDMGMDTFASDPTALKYGSEMNVFAIKSDGGLFKNTYQPSTSSWSGWNQLGSGISMAGKPAAIQFGSDMIVLSRSTAGNLYRNTWNGTSWSGFIQITGNGSTVLASDPTVVQFGNEVDVFIRGADSNLWKAGRNGSTWGTLGSMGGGNLMNNPSAIAYGSEMIVFSNDTNGTLIKLTWNGSNWSWAQLTGHSFVGSPTAITYGSEVDVYARDSSSAIYKNTWLSGGTNWSGWNSIGGNEMGDPTVSLFNGEMIVWATNYANNTDRNSWQPWNNNWTGFTALL